MKPSRSPGDEPPTQRRRDALRTLGVGTVGVAAGLLFTTSARLAGPEGIRDETASVTDLLRRQDRENARLTEVNAAKRADQDRLAAEAGHAPEDLPELATTATRVGLAAVEGPGLRVSLSDAPTSALTTVEGVRPDDLVVHQQDMEAYINALWAGGAEAMMLQDQRVINGSAFRCAGNTLLLEGRVYSPPFVVTAIGDRDGMMRALEAAEGVILYRQWRDHVGLGERIERLARLELPAYDGTLALQEARPLTASVARRAGAPR
ncbi:DUF881 domain-containing protein [Brachybacterium sp. EF45031]|uniref:DUF881 domain-containing protein n=1 Tax=Brachybacterium sillae TaxID=2810536 RepID=UPI00217DCE0A|nr:DUF881 domain-containing protein [Brachybacterium sillae]MCS6712067.1 DUF881 domain-containing protein [Brachybacterium sillae]